MIQDLNKGINSITYNHLNLPKKITYSTSSQNISYLCNALGAKVQKKVFKSGIVGTFNPDHTVTTDYLSGFHYEFNDNPNIVGNSGLVFFATAEGYVNVITRRSVSYNYVYNYTDHLGNVRVSYTSGTGGVASILEENHYYPFGLKHKKYGSTVKNFVEIEDGDGYFVGIEIVPPGARKTYQYKYNGKEFQDELGLNFYDYGFRNYAPDLGRWMNIDPLASKYSSVTPYNYAYNNPVYFIDPDGMQATDFDTDDIIDIEVDTGKITVTKAEGNDIVRAVDNGKVVDSYEYGENGSFTADTTIEQTEVGGIDSTVVSSSNTEKMQEFFEFAAENTKVEFGIVHAEKNNISESSVITSGQPFSVPVSFLALNKINSGYTVSEVSHSHPEGGVAQPSGFNPDGTINTDKGDRTNAGVLQRKQSSTPIIFKVYHPSSNSVFNFNDKSFERSDFKK